MTSTPDFERGAEQKPYWALLDFFGSYLDSLEKIKRKYFRCFIPRRYPKRENEPIAMDIEKREQELRAQQLVLEAFATRLAGEKDYDLEESKNLINKLIEDYKG